MDYLFGFFPILHAHLYYAHCLSVWAALGNALSYVTCVIYMVVLFSSFPFHCVHGDFSWFSNLFTEDTIYVRHIATHWCLKSQDQGKERQQSLTQEPQWQLFAVNKRRFIQFKTICTRRVQVLAVICLMDIVDLYISVQTVLHLRIHSLCMT